ncbi:cytochrome oxidase small assembly protein [Pseudoduganella sp. RAF53_2]
MSDPKKPNSNLRLALILLSIAVVFFVSVIGKQWILRH